MKGQISLETLMAIGAMLVLLVMVLAHNSNVKGSAELLSEKFDENNKCLKLAYIISEVYSQGENTRISFQLETDANVLAAYRVIEINQQHCGFLANAEDKELSRGRIIASNSNGQVVFESA